MIDAGWWLTQLTTLLVAAMGVAILFVRPRTAPARALSFLLVSYGVGILALNLSEAIHIGDLGRYLRYGRAAEWVGAASALGAVLGAGILLATFPQPLSRGERRTMLPFALLVAASALVAVPFARTTLARGSEPLRYLDAAGLLTFEAGLLAMLGTVAGLALRYNRLSPGPQSDLPRAQIRTMAAGLALPSAFTLSYNLVIPDMPAVVVAVGALSVALVMALWIVAAHRGADPRGARAIAWLVGVAALTPLVLRALGIDPDAGGAFGLMRLVAFAILAYGLLRGQLLGLDVKVRWTVGKSTIAGAFIAVFFVASEAAQQFFGDTLGSTYVGIVAAGALVFAMAPLQRAAERLAERTVPRVPGREAPPLESAAATAYKAALRAARRDGTVTRREERHLAEVARALGIDPVQAHEWRAQVEDELQDSAEAA